MTVPNPDIDTDSDGITDNNETSTDPYDADTDDDGISDSQEDDFGTNPGQRDTDGDGIQDGTELGDASPVSDPDGTGPLLGTDVAVFVPDGDSSATTTSALLWDTDGDGMSDSDEDANQNGIADAGEQDPNFSDCDFQLYNQTVPAGATRQYVSGCTITVGPNYVIEPNAAIVLRAADTITLLPGFHAMEGCTFDAAIQ